MPLSHSETLLATRLYSTIAKLKARPASPAGVAGLKLQLALMLLEDEPQQTGADNSFWEAKCR